MDLAKTELEVDDTSETLDAIEDHAVASRAAIVMYTNQHYPIQPIAPQILPQQANLAAVPMAIKRKPLEVPKFDGRRPEDWSGFWTTFCVQYGDNAQMDNVNKLLHLRTYLFGDALNDIKALEITAPNYTIAVERLKKKYGDILLLENKFITNLSNLPTVKDEKDRVGLHQLHHHVEMNIQNLANINVKLEEFQRTLFPTLATAIPQTLMREYDRENAAERSVTCLMKWLHEFVTKEAQYEMMASQNKSTTPPSKSNASSESSNR
uniref:Uncharacterized protein n=1 Tax=Strigamia maritima TaxID=126957 RepID=T1JKG8_STRMM